MKSFHSFITERRRNPGRPGGPGPSEAERVEAKGNTSKGSVNPSRTPRFRGRARNFSIDDILRDARRGAAAAADKTPEQTPLKRPVRVTNNPSGQTITNLPGGNIPDEQKFATLERIAKQKSSKSVAAADDVSVQMRTQAADTAARAKETGPAKKIKLGATTAGGEVKTYKLGQSSQPSKEAAKTLQRMTTADPVTTKRLQSNLSRSDAARQAAARRSRLATAADKTLTNIRGEVRGTASRMSAAVEKTRAADKALADKANEILKQTRAKTPPTVKATPTPTPAPKPTAAPKPKAVELPKFTKPAPTKVAPPPQTLNKFLRPRPVADVKPKAMPSPATATQTPAPKPQFRSTTPKSTIPSDVPADVANQMRSTGYDKPGSSTSADKARITKKIETLTPSQSATNRAVNRAVKQAVRKPQVRAIRGASTALKGLGVAGTALDARSEYLYRKNELGQSASTATAGSAARTGGGLAGGRLGAIKGAQLGGKFGPKGALIGGAIGGIAGYLGGSSLGTKAFDAVQSPKSAAKSYKQFIKGLSGNK